MKHEDAVLLVPDLGSADLPEPTRIEVKDHVAVCEECRSLGDLTFEIDRALKEEAAAPRARATGPHPDRDGILSFALRPRSLTEDQNARMSAHLRRCGICARAVEAVRVVERQVGSNDAEGYEAHPNDASPPIGRSVAAFPARAARSPRLWPSVAVAAGVALLLLPSVYLGLIVVPGLQIELEHSSEDGARLRGLVIEAGRARERVEEDLDAARAQAGAVPLYILRGELRDSGGTLTRIIVAEGQSILNLALEPIIHATTGPGEPIRFEIEDAQGTAVWDTILDASRIRDLVKSSEGVLFLRAPGAKLLPGRYMLVESGPEGSPLKRLSFEVVRP